MELNDLKTGHVVELRNGDKMMVLRDFITPFGKMDVFFNPDNYEWYRFIAYNKNMTFTGNGDHDIIAVFEYSCPNYKDYEGKLVWVREETNWLKVKKDTPIWVRDNLLGDWKPRYFDKYENGRIYAFNDGKASHTAKYSVDWNYAKLEEN